MKSVYLIFCILIAFSGYSQKENAVAIDSPEFSRVIQILESGYWIWETGSCDEQKQMFKFDLDNNTMTLSYFPAAEDESEIKNYTYDILEAWPSKFRSKIIGEERLDSSGSPIEWDLILIDQSSFYWRRNDWALDYGTKSIIRCP